MRSAVFSKTLIDQWDDEWEDKKKARKRKINRDMTEVYKFLRYSHCNIYLGMNYINFFTKYLA